MVDDGSEFAVYFEWMNFMESRFGLVNDLTESLANYIFEYGRNKEISHVYTSVRWDSPDLLSFFKRLNFEKSNYINLLKRLDT